uniref:probable serine/threonine-protein kinase At1g01540 n=1 Tax=Erigeron canadensis TaxID=72917 RepID=UPI001CB97735|nr:probable serine/threonine-protein kinase At1g01540 [Erigeron canadensis]
MSGFLKDKLSSKTSIFGLRFWVVLGICLGATIVIIILLLSLYFTKRNKYLKKPKPSPQKPTIISHTTDEIQSNPVGLTRPETQQTNPPDKIQYQAENPVTDSESLAIVTPHAGETDASNLNGYEKIQIEIGKLKANRIAYPGYGGGSSYGSGSGEQSSVVSVQPEVSHLGWGHWYTLRELEVATNGFSDENVIGEGGYGIVYSGVLTDNTMVAVKNLLNNRGQAEREFKVEVEAIGRVRHKNLVRLLGYCAEGAQRILVYEYVNNGNLEQWLHGDVGPTSPLTWEIRMNIILGTAKGLTYLHEGLEPKVVHRDIKSSNILLNRQWHPKVSDFGLAKLLGSEKSYVTTRVMGTFGYVAPEYASTGMLNERSDVYSFGILIMEIISGRNPVDYSRPPDEVNLVDWLKAMVTNRTAEGVLDPKLPERPSSRALKRALLVALRCVDPSAQKRPKMGHVIHMLEADDFPFRDEHRGNRENGRERLMEKRYIESGDSSGYESSRAPTTSN